MNPVRLFPEGVALGDAFINRIQERNALIKNIKSTKHTVLMAPRRYGKTSLVMQVADEMGLPSCTIDLLAAYSADFVRDQIVDRVGRLVIELLPSLAKGKEKLMQTFKRMKPEVTLTALGQKLLLQLSAEALTDVADVLLKLDEVAKHFRKKAVIFLDEFQQISQLQNHHAIEAAIRHAVERSENITYVFSGSNRRLLQHMFGDSSRPLYRLCHVMVIERMEKSVYIDHLQSLAKKKWKRKLSDDALERLFYHTELHPFYMNALCQLLWDQSELLSVDLIDATWHQYIKTQKRMIAHDIVSLSVNQKKILSALAKTPAKEVQSAQFISPLKISASSAQQAVAVLLEKDLLYINNENYHCLLDPAMKYYLNVILWESEL